MQPPRAVQARTSSEGATGDAAKVAAPDAYKGLSNGVASCSSGYKRHSTHL